MDSLVYVIAGDEYSLVEARYQELINEQLTPSQRATGLLVAQTDTISACEVLDELRTLPFLTDKRVVVLKQADDFISENRELLEKYFDEPCPTGRLVLVVHNWDARTRLAKKLGSVGRLINVESPQRWELPKYLIKYANDVYGKKLSTASAELIIALTGDELAGLYSQVDKLALYADTEKVITQQHIELLIGNNRLYNAFSVIDAILADNLGKAVERLRRMFEADRSAEFTVVGAFAYHFRRLFNAKVLQENGRQRAEIEKRLNIRFGRDAFFEQLKKMSLKQIRAVLSRLGEIDYQLKTGQARPQAAIECLILKL
jgi:DNA polymerase-3 subunit delta